MTNTYFNSDLSLLEFNERVLHYSSDESIPIMEKLKYLCISSANMDEFYGVKYREAMESGDGETLEKIVKKAKEISSEQYRRLREVIVPGLEAGGIIFKTKEYSEAESKWIKEYFKNEVAPLLSPIGIDPAHPFPKVANKDLHFVVKLKGKDAFGRDLKYAIMKLPSVLPRIIQIPNEDGKNVLTTMSSIITNNIGLLLDGIKMMGCYAFRVTRDTNIKLNENTSQDLLPNIKDQLLSRNYGIAVRLEITSRATQGIIEYLQTMFKVDDTGTFMCEGAVNLHRLLGFEKFVKKPDMYFDKHTPKWPKELKEYALELPNPSMNIFGHIKKHDSIVLRHPHHSFEPVLELLRQGANDKDTLSIRITLYRTSKDSKIIKYLEQAARNGKEVTAVVELKARFDEHNNISTAKRLQLAGVNVTYGVLSHKTHAKMLLISRRENGKIKHYHHTSTGNYHEDTSKLYTDIGVISCDKQIGFDISNIFLQLTALVPTKKLSKVVQSPFNLKNMFIKNIENEISIQESGGEGRIIAKMNGLQEKSVVDALYKASNAGVKITLVVRGICTLIPGVRDMSENIEVKSVIGRFLEHSRIYYFGNDGNSKLYLSTADLMSRNLNRRIEIAVPVKNLAMKQDILDGSLMPYIKDNTNSWWLKEDGDYVLGKYNGDGDGTPYCAQGLI